MKQALLTLCAAVGFAAMAFTAQAQNYVEVTNLTFSGGDPIFQITNDVTFNNLSVGASYADGTTASIALFDSTHTAQTSLDTSTISLASDPVLTDFGAHGGITNLTLTGTFDQTNLDLASALGGPTTNVDVNPNFTTTIGPHVAYIYAIDANTGAQYAAGTFSYLNPTGSPVPEPSSALALGTISTLTVGAVFIRRRIKRA